MKYSSCQNPVPPVSRTKLAHHSLCGSERAHLSRDSKSRQYWRMPPWGGTREKIMFSCKSSPSGCSATDLAILGPKPSSVLSPLGLLTRIPRYITTRSGKADRSTVRLSVLSAISPPCSNLATMGLGESNAGLARAHLQPRSFSTAGHDLDHEHNLLVESNSRVFVKRKPHPDDENRGGLVHPRCVPTVDYPRHPTLPSG